MKLISMCLWKRLDVAKSTLHALSRCPGIRDYRLLIHIDGGGDPAMFDWARTIGCCQSKEFLVAKQNLGCNESTRRVLTRAFELSDYVIHVEEDVVLAPDALRYFEWARQFEFEPKLFTVGAWRHDSGWRYEVGCPFPLNDNPAGKVRTSHTFHVWGWATWANRWRAMDGNWTKGNDQSLSWDTNLTAYRHRMGFYEIVPLISRAVNIGHGGIHRGDHPLSYWAGSEGFVTPQTYQRVP